MVVCAVHGGAQGLKTLSNAGKGSDHGRTSIAHKRRSVVSSFFTSSGLRAWVSAIRQGLIDVSVSGTSAQVWDLHSPQLTT